MSRPGGCSSTGVSKISSPRTRTLKMLQKSIPSQRKIIIAQLRTLRKKLSKPSISKTQKDIINNNISNLSSILNIALKSNKIAAVTDSVTGATNKRWLSLFILPSSMKKGLEKILKSGKNICKSIKNNIKENAKTYLATLAIASPLVYNQKSEASDGRIRIDYKIESSYDSSHNFITHNSQSVEGIDNRDLIYGLPPPPSGVTSKIVSVVEGHELMVDGRPTNSTSSIDAYYSVITTNGQPVPQINNPYFTVAIDHPTSGVVPFEDEDVFLTVEGTTYDAKQLSANGTQIPLSAINGTATISFTPHAPQIVAPTLDTLVADSVTTNSANLNGKILEDGKLDGTIDCTYRFSYRTEDSDWETTSWDGSVTDGQTFSTSVSNLLPNTVYVVRAEASNTAGATIGDLEYFLTESEPIEPNEPNEPNEPVEPNYPDPNAAPKLITDPNTLLIQNNVKAFFTDPNFPHQNQGVMTYLQNKGNLQGIDPNDSFFYNPTQKGSKIISIIPYFVKDKFVGFHELETDARPKTHDPNAPVLIETAIYSPLVNEPNLTSTNALKFWLARDNDPNDPNAVKNAFDGKPLTIQRVSNDPNVTYPVYDVRSVITNNKRQITLDKMNSQRFNSPYAHFEISTDRKLMDFNSDGKITREGDYAILQNNLGKNGPSRMDIASIKNGKLITGLPDGKVTSAEDEVAFITEHNKLNPENPIPFPFIGYRQDFEESEFPSDFISSGDKEWRIDSSNSSSGSSSVRSGKISNSQVSTLETVVESEEGNIKFSRKVSSESGFDRLTFSINGYPVDEWSGEKDWEQVEYKVEPGVYELKWEYEKDDSVSSGEDAAWIDDVIVS